MLKRVAVVLFIITVLLIIDVTKENEDAIIVYSSMEQFRNEALQEQLTEAFPDKNVSVMYMSTGKAASKIRMEGENADADIIVGLECAYLEKIKDNLEYVSDMTKLDYIDGMQDPDGKYLIWERQDGSIIVNRTVLEKYDLPMPQTYEDLLRPEYKNRIAMPDPKSSGTGYFFYKGLVNVWGEEKTLQYFDKLAINIKQFTESGSGPIKLLIQQEVAIGLGLTFQGVKEQNEGNDLVLIEPEFGSPYSLTGSSIIKGKREKEGVAEVFEFIVNHALIYDKEYLCPGQILKEQQNYIENYPVTVNYADMHGIEDMEEKERLLQLWKY